MSECFIVQVEVTRDVVLQEMSAARPSYTTRVLLGVDEVCHHILLL